jgi:hypothetical protein
VGICCASVQSQSSRQNSARFCIDASCCSNTSDCYSAHALPPLLLSRTHVTRCCRTLRVARSYLQDKRLACLAKDREAADKTVLHSPTCCILLQQSRCSVYPLHMSHQVSLLPVTCRTSALRVWLRIARQQTKLCCAPPSAASLLQQVCRCVFPLAYV